VLDGQQLYYDAIGDGQPGETTSFEKHYAHRLSTIRGAVNRPLIAEE
jgi:hypothetical protein